MFNSAKIRLTLWYVGVLALFLTLFAAAVYFSFAYALRSQVDGTLSEIAASFETSVQGDIEDEKANDKDQLISEALSDAVVETNFKSYPMAVFSGPNDLVAANDDGGIAKSLTPAVARDPSNELRRNFSTVVVGGKPLRTCYHPFQLSGRNFFLIVAYPLNDLEQMLRTMRDAFLTVIPLSLLLAGLGGFFLARKSLAPIAAMSEKAGKITAQNLHERVPVENENDEFGRLAAAFNSLLSRLDLSFEQQKRFMADASHELRTPVSIIRGEAEVSLTRDFRKAAEYRETISIIQSEAERMSKIIEDLFILARADSGQEMLQTRPVYVNDILSETVKSFRTLSSRRNVEIQLINEFEMPIQGDEHLLRRLFTNLIDNAVKHAESSVNVEAALSNGFYEIRISDDGQGIAPEHYTNIFDRFYRVETARTRIADSDAGSGSGLGLSIARLVAEYHQGSVELLRSGPEGSVFVARFPVAAN